MTRRVEPVKKKIGTVIEESLLKRAKAAAAAEGTPLNRLLEEALMEYLNRYRGVGKGSAVMSTWGAVQVDGPLLQAVMEEESVIES